MIVRHYPRKSHKRIANPDAALDAAIAQRIREHNSLPSFRGTGVVTPPPNVFVAPRKRVRRSEGYIARNGAWIAREPAPYLEVSRDVRYGSTRSMKDRNTPSKGSTLTSKDRKQTLSDVSLMARMGSIHQQATGLWKAA